MNRPPSREERRRLAGVTDEIVRADPRARKAALTVVVAGGAIAAAGIAWLAPAVEGWTQSPDALLPLDLRLACFIILGMVSLMALSVFGFGVSVIRSGRRVQEEGRYPPSGVKLVRDTRLLVGPAAKLMGRGQIMIGATLIGCAILLVVVSTYGVIRLLR